jgi:alpha-galactosidase
LRLNGVLANKEALGMAFARLDADSATAVFDLRDRAQPTVAYVGTRLPAFALIEDLAVLLAEGPRPSTADKTPLVSVCPVAGEGFQGAPGLILADGRPVRLRLMAAAEEAEGLVLMLEDAASGVRVTQSWRAAGSGFLIRTRIDNISNRSIGVAQLSAVALPLPGWARRRLTFAGSWAGEFVHRSHPIADGLHEVASRGGRPGFENAGFLVVAGEDLSAFGGSALALHLAWSGNSRSLVERTGFGQGQIQIGERLEPGELALAPGDSYETPGALLVVSSTGLDGVRQGFHGLALRMGAPFAGARRVHFNSWEAVYFDFDLERLKGLAADAAALGAERFVLDDGWFLARRSDAAGLGDWAPDPERFPDGLGPLIAHVESLGMDFGLWVEPEMVNPNSTLYRAHPDWAHPDWAHPDWAHPDWALASPGGEAPTQRNQLVLDLSREEVRDHVFKSLDRLLQDNRIAYLKWDHNRDLFPCPSPRAQTLGFYQLLDRLRTAHPGVEIESCASGGGRIDFGVLQRCTRFWVSDNTDALARLSIQSAASLFLPLNRIGSHVGSSPNPSTGRRLSMLLRARIALFSHMGIEADPSGLDAEDRETLAAHIALYKEHRALIHGGRFACYKGDDPGVTIWQCTTGDRSEALILAVRGAAGAGLISPPLRLAGLDRHARYRIDLVRPWPDPARRFLGERKAWRGGVEAHGALLMETGLRLPLLHPETAWLLHIKVVGEKTP